MLLLSVFRQSLPIIRCHRMASRSIFQLSIKGLVASSPIAGVLEGCVMGLKRRKTTATKKPKAVAVKTEVHNSPIQTPRKRQRRTHGIENSTEETPSLKNSSSAAADVKTEAVNGERKARATRKSKKLLETLHTEHTLPAIQEKASKVFLASVSCCCYIPKSQWHSNP